VGALLKDEINQRMQVAGKTICVDVNIGAVSEQDCDNPNNLFLYADIAAGEARQSGHVVFFTPGMREQLRRKTMAQDLRMAISNGQLSIVSHNIVSAEDYSLASCEILSRWAHPELGHISPVEFIPVAEESGIIVELGDWVIHQAMAAQPLLEQMAGKPVKVAVNVSLYQLLQRTLSTS
jgi:predicted signal transduction protein with EAL and GGDEF domain